MKPHKHAEVIKAWADGVTIQWKDRASDTWIDWKSIYCLGFDVDTDYRVKPPKRELWTRPLHYPRSKDPGFIYLIRGSNAFQLSGDPVDQGAVWAGPAVKVWEESE